MLRGIVRASENEPVCQPQAPARGAMSAATVSYRTHLAVSAAEASLARPPRGAGASDPALGADADTGTYW